MGDEITLLTPNGEVQYKVVAVASDYMNAKTTSLYISHANIAADFGRINRYDGPEDGALSDRCLTLGLPEFGTAFGGSFRRIVQTPGGVSMFYDVGQGNSWQRNIVMDGSPHLPSNIRQWFGDSRGHWDGNTLVVNTTGLDERAWLDNAGNPKSFHAVFEERYTRTSYDEIELQISVTDPAYYTAPWVSDVKTFKKEARDGAQVNHFGWYGLFSGLTDLICAPKYNTEIGRAHV